MNECLNNIFNDLPMAVHEELFETLTQNRHVKIERIISKGQSSPPDFWYDQAYAEWVLLLQGQARLQFLPQRTIITLKSGDYLLIPPHQQHRVDWTDPESETIWLAIHLYENE